MESNNYDRSIFYCLFILFLLIITYYSIKTSSRSPQEIREFIRKKDLVSIENKAATLMEYAVCQCPENLYCSNPQIPVMNGLDFVQYFLNFQLSNSSPENFQHQYSEAQFGIQNFSSLINGYQFLFINQYNKDLFDNSPEMYIPQFNGFCSWGVSAEYCPTHPWSDACLGPIGDPKYWLIFQDKLYFFASKELKEKFQNFDNLKFLILNGNVRWNSWFPDKSSIPYLTQCTTS